VGAQVIAAIPHVSNWRRNKDAMLVMRSDPKSPVAEAYRTLATNIQYLASRRPLSSIMVTSAMGSEGKTTTASNLAVALAQTGGRVLLVSADVRRPRLHEFFHIARSPGLTNLLRGEAHLSDVAQDVGRSNLKVVAAGPTPSNPAELLTGGRAAEVLRMMREVADFVILDAPPTLAVADASILAPLVDGTLCIVGAERSSRSTLGQIRTQLDNVGADVIGVVYNNFDPNKAAAYPYAYTYYREYYADDPKATNGHATAQRKKDLRRARREPATHGSFGFQPDSQGDPPVTVGEVPAGSDPSSPPANGAS
jgi:capsular exopolysaccharide synthesis family protein